MAQSWDDLVVVGRIARPQGHRGEVVVDPATDFPDERFAPGATVWIEREGVPVAVVIRQARIHKGRPVIVLDGVETMNDAERFRGLELRVPEQDLRPLPAGVYYQFQLVGCEVSTTGGERVGTVRAVEGEAGQYRLAVAAPEGEVLVPLVAPICREIDVEARRIVIDPPVGLLGVNRPTGGAAG